MTTALHSERDSRTAAAQLDFASYRQQNYRPALDGLRAVSIVLVFLNHLSAFGVTWYFWVCGWTGVWVFFIISGYLINMLLLREEKARGSVDLKAFYIRRLARIVPPYYLVLALYTALSFSPVGQGKGVAFLSTLPWFLSFNAEIAPDIVAFGQAWTLGIEEKFYLAFPIVLFLLVGGWSRYRNALIAVSIAVCFAVNSLYAMSYCALLFGALLAYYLDHPGVYKTAGRVVNVPGLGYALILGSGWLVARYHETLALPSNISFGWIALCCMYVVTDALISRGARFVFLTLPVVRLLGRLSYAFYLIHVVAINTCAPLAKHGFAGQVAAVPVAFGLAIAMAAAIHYVVERPCISFGKRVLAARREKSARVSAA